MIDFRENEVLGTALPAIRDEYGQEKTDALVEAVRGVEKLSQLGENYQNMVKYGILNTDFSTGRPKKAGKKRVKKAFLYQQARDGRSSAGGRQTTRMDAVSYAELRKYNPYHDERGRFASANGFRTYSADRRIKQPWGENNSLMAHMDPDTGTVSRERAALYNRIINKYLEGVEPPADGKPTLDYMGGGGGSGKSYTISQGVVQVPGKGKAVQINSDDIKMEIPEFRQRAASDDEAISKGAANYVHEESSKITKYLTQAAMAKGLNIVIDGVASDPEKLSQEIKAARDGGYSTVRAHYVATPTEIALAASRSRYSDNPNKEERRYVPDDVILEAHKKVSANFPALSELFDSVEVVQNDRSSPVRRIAYKERGGEMQVTDQAAYQAFLDKGK